MTTWPAALNATEYSIFVISRTLRLTYMPLFRRKAQPRQAHSPARHDDSHHTRNHSPGAKHRNQGASDGQRAHRCALCSCTTLHRSTASTCSEVGLVLRAIWTTSWLAAPNGSLDTYHMGRAHRLPRLRCRRSNSQLQRRTLSRSLERPQRSAASKRFAAGHPFQVSYVRIIVSSPKARKNV